MKSLDDSKSGNTSRVLKSSKLSVNVRDHYEEEFLCSYCFSCGKEFKFLELQLHRCVSYGSGAKLDVETREIKEEGKESDNLHDGDVVSIESIDIKEETFDSLKASCEISYVSDYLDNSSDYCVSNNIICAAKETCINIQKNRNNILLDKLEAKEISELCRCV